VQEAKETKKEREAVAELLRVLKAGEVTHDVAKEVKVEHSYFVGWLQKARIFCRLDRAVQQRPAQANSDIFGTTSTSPPPPCFPTNVQPLKRRLPRLRCR
jgi:hypothetical protein